MSPIDKPLVWLEGPLSSPPLSTHARREIGFLLRLLQRGETLGMPHSRPMPVIGRRCHELRVPDTNLSWRVVYRVDHSAVIVAGIFPKKTERTPKNLIARFRNRFAHFDLLAREP